jgi:protein-disulfide isomerase
METDEKLTKKQKKEQRRLESLDRDQAAKKTGTTKWAIIIISALLFLGTLVYMINASKEVKKEQTSAQLTSAGWVRGDKDAPVTLVEFSDLQCPACGFREPMVQQALKDYDGKVKLLYKHFPLTTIHKNAMGASRAAEAAGKQGKFWEMHDMLFEKQDTWQALPDAKKEFVAYAQALKLDMNKFEQDYNSKEIEDKINKERDEGIQLGVNGTPTFFLNGKVIDTPMSYEDLKKSIDEVVK